MRRYVLQNVLDLEAVYPTIHALIILKSIVSCESLGAPLAVVYRDFDQSEWFTIASHTNFLMSIIPLISPFDPTVIDSVVSIS